MPIVLIFHYRYEVLGGSALDGGYSEMSINKTNNNITIKHHNVNENNDIVINSKKVSFIKLTFLIFNILKMITIYYNLVLLLLIQHHEDEILLNWHLKFWQTWYWQLKL